jgi:membrane protein
MFSNAPAQGISVSFAWRFRNESRRTDNLFGRLEELFGLETSQMLEGLVDSAFERPSGGSPLVSLISLGALIYAATGLFAQLVYALNFIWDAPPPAKSGVVAFILTRLIAFLMVLGVGLLFVVLTLVSVAISLLASIFEWSRYVPFLNFLGFVGVAALLFALLYKVLPNVKLSWRDVWPGAILTACLFGIGWSLIGFYLGRSSIGSAFEAAGALAILLIGVYYAAQAFLFGVVFTKVYAQGYGSRQNRDVDAEPA